jgi:uncharacterized protein
LRVVLDTSVYVAGLLNPRGGSGECLRLWYEDALFDVIASQNLFDELLRTLHKPKLQGRFAPSQPQRSVSAFTQVAQMLEDVPSPQALTRASNDDFLVSLAIAGAANALVSLDDDLLTLKAIRAQNGVLIPVIRPGELLAWLRDARVL